MHPDSKPYDDGEEMEALALGSVQRLAPSLAKFGPLGVREFLMGAATIIIFAAVLHRYGSGFPIPGVPDALLAIDMGWAQESCIFMFVWMATRGP